MRELPIYEIMIDLNDPDTTVSFNSLVVHPAHEKMFNTFSKQVKYQFNDDEQIITGIAISADTPIYRRGEKSNEEYYVVFTPKAIKDIVFDYARRENFNNVNLEHDSKRVVDGIYMIMSYIIDESKGFTAPERFKDESDGSWIVSYKVTNKDVYDAVQELKMRKIHASETAWVGTDFDAILDNNHTIDNLYKQAALIVSHEVSLSPGDSLFA